jgi:hypothetical protein
MNRSLVLAAAAAATLFTATAANAARVDWSIGINLPPVATYVSSAPAYYGAPAYYAPAPAYYAPAPYYAPRVVEYAPRPRFWVPPAPARFRGHDRWHHDGDHDRDDHRGDRGDHRDGRVDWRR